MSLIEAVKPILGSKTTRITLDVSANPRADNEIVVVVKPVVAPVPSNATEELKQLCAALATPIKIIGTPDTVEAEFAAAVAQQAPDRQSWDERAAALEAQIAAGAKADAKKSAAPAKKPTSPGNPVNQEPAKEPEATGAEQTNNPFSL